MRSTLLSVALLLAATISLASDTAAQRRLGKICGDPNAPCGGRDQFQPWELTFGLPKNAVIYESEYFYSVILKSVKLPQNSYAECEKAFSEDERLKIQELFPKNKVFAFKCSEPGSMYYTNVANDVSFLGIYAGKTRVQADAFLKTVKATGRFPGASLRRMKAGINGT
jgi:hypothetical protein